MAADDTIQHTMFLNNTAIKSYSVQEGLVMDTMLTQFQQDIAFECGHQLSGC